MGTENKPLEPLDSPQTLANSQQQPLPEQMYGVVVGLT